MPMRRVILIVVFFIITCGTSFAQCAMCRATLETSVSNGESLEMAATLNFAILYLLALPYLLVLTVGLLLYRKSKAAQLAAKTH